MTIIYNGNRFQIPDDYPFPKQVQLELAIASQGSPNWVPVIGSLDSGCEYPVAVSKNILVKHGIRAKVIKREKAAFADGEPQTVEVVHINLMVRGVNSENTMLYGLPAILLDLDDQVTLGSVLFLFTTIMKKGRIELIGFNERAIR